jgi:hypothetical protein
MPRLMSRLGVVLGGCALAVLCCLSAIDRSVGLDGTPNPALNFFNFGISNIRQSAMSAPTASPWRAIDASRRLVDRAPIERLTSSVLGSAELASGKENLANEAFRVAASFGWRDPIVQRYWMTSALATGDAVVAAQRANALLRTSDSATDAEAALATLEESPAGRTAVAEQLAEGPPWIQAYLASLGLLEREGVSTRLLTLRLARRGGLRLDLHQADIAVRALFIGNAQTSFDLWTTLRGVGDIPKAGLWDADFRHVEIPPSSPFLWTIIPVASAEARVDSVPGTPGHRGLKVSSSSVQTEYVASQNTVLKAGTYAVEWRAVDGVGAPSRDISIRIRCVKSGASIRSAAEAAGAAHHLMITVPTTGCSAQTLFVVVSPAPSGLTITGGIDHVKIAPAGP